MMVIACCHAPEAELWDEDDCKRKMALGDGWAWEASPHSSTGNAQSPGDALHVSRAAFLCAHPNLCICRPSLSLQPEPLWEAWSYPVSDFLFVFL